LNLTAPAQLHALRNDWRLTFPPVNWSSFMQTIYNSDNYCVVVFPDAPNGAGFEIMDKQLKREIYIGGDVARAFQSKVRELMESEPDQEDVDAFLTQFDGLMHHGLNTH
jgi:hypothetical protein